MPVPRDGHVREAAVGAARGAVCYGSVLNTAAVLSIRRFRILDGDFTVESGQLSAKLGIRRSVLAKDFAADIDMLYS
jgi:long-subunit acyl-CoA synthetase (AMP-forming)